MANHVTQLDWSLLVASGNTFYPKTHLLHPDGKHALCGTRVKANRLKNNGYQLLLNRLVRQGETPTCLNCQAIKQGKRAPWHKLVVRHWNPR